MTFEDQQVYSGLKPPRFSQAFLKNDSLVIKPRSRNLKMLSTSKLMKSANQNPLANQTMDGGFSKSAVRLNPILKTSTLSKPILKQFQRTSYLSREESATESSGTQSAQRVSFDKASLDHITLDKIMVD